MKTPISVTQTVFKDVLETATTMKVPKVLPYPIQAPITTATPISNPNISTNSKSSISMNKIIFGITAIGIAVAAVYFIDKYLQKQKELKVN